MLCGKRCRNKRPGVTSGVARLVSSGPLTPQAYAVVRTRPTLREYVRPPAGLPDVHAAWGLRGQTDVPLHRDPEHHRLSSLRVRDEERLRDWRLRARACAYLPSSHGETRT